MFVSQPQYEFPIPLALDASGAQHWRMVELSIHAPWFLVSIDIADPDVPGRGMTRTLCIAWECDLAEVLLALDAKRVKGIVCMVPAWQSLSGQWTSREVREVWQRRSEAGQSVVLRDAAGEEFDCGLVPDHVEPIDAELILRLAAATPQRRYEPQQAKRTRSSKLQKKA